MESCLVVLFMCYFASISAINATVTDDVSSDPSSELSGCSKIPVVENANVSLTSLKSSYTQGDSLIYNCQRGYVGRVSFTCNGHKWESSRKAQCSRKRCTLPQDIPNGRFALINGTEFVYEAIIKYTCKTGYRMATRADTRTCLPEGWSNHLPECEEIICLPPETKSNVIVNGLPDYDNPLRYGHHLQFACDSPGYKIIGPNEIICEENGEWSGTFPSCEEVFCEFKPIHGMSVFGLPEDNAPIKYGHKLNFHCAQAGTVLKGNNEISCSNDGNWSHPFPRCEEITCKTEELNNVFINSGLPGIHPPYRPNHYLTFQCVKADMHMIGHHTIACKQDGTWSSSYPKCLENIGCGPPPPIAFADTVTLRRNYYNNGATVQYQCQNFYILYGSATATCAYGRWTGTLRCLKPCTVTIEKMDALKIQQYHGEKRLMFAKHAEFISFQCQYRRQAKPNSAAFRQQCIDGVMHLPSCQ